MDKDDFKKWRRDRGMTQKELAAALGVHHMAVAYWEWGKRRISPLLPLALEALEIRMKAGGAENGTDD